MKKTTFTKLLALVVGVIVLVASLTSAINVFAADPAAAGTVAAGMANNTELYTIGLQNGDFQKGFMYWTADSTSTASANQYANIVTEGTNKYMQLNVTTAAAGTRGVKSCYFVVPKASTYLKKGDNIAVIFGFNGTPDNNFRIGVTQLHTASASTAGGSMVNGGSAKKLADAKAGSSFAIYSTINFAGGNLQRVVNDSNVAADSAAGIAAGDFVFQITISANANKTSSAKFDDIMLAKYDKTAQKYYSLVDGSEIIDGQPTGSGSGYDGAAGGTAEDAVNTIYGGADGLDKMHVATYNWSYIKPLDAPYNLNFQHDFRAWTGRATHNGGSAYKPTWAYEIVTEANGNKYAKLRDGSREGNTMVMVLTKVSNVQAGDKVVPVFDWKGDMPEDKIQLVLSQVIMKSDDYRQGQAKNFRLIDGFLKNGKDITNSNTPSGWKTGAMAPAPLNTIEQPETSQSQNFYLSLTVGLYQVETTDVYDFCVDNIRFAKMSADGKVYTDIATNTVIYDANAPTGTGTGSGTGTGTGTGAGTGGSSATGTGKPAGSSNATGDSVLMLAALFFVSGAGVFGTAKALKKR